jgi:hypothetical protein
MKKTRYPQCFFLIYVSKELKQGKKIIQWMLLNGITLGQAISDYNNRMISISELPFLLNDAALGNGTCKTKIILLGTLSVIPLNSAVLKTEGLKTEYKHRRLILNKRLPFSPFFRVLR